MYYRRLYDWPTLGLRSSFDELSQMKRNMDRIFGQISDGYLASQGAGVFPLINLTETKDGYHIRAELPGVKSGQLDIQATAKTISITGERRIDPEKNDVKYHRREREGGKFSRIISLPGDIDSGKVDAKLVNGILLLKIPKAEQAKPKQIAIK